MTERTDEYYHGALAVCDICGGKRQRVKRRDAGRQIAIQCTQCKREWLIPETLPVDHGSKRSGAYEWPEEGKERSGTCQIKKAHEQTEGVVR